MNLDTRYLPAFVAVCEEGGISRAAVKLHRTQPAVSYQIKMLERQMNTLLFERTGGRLVLTPAGSVLRDFCSRFFSEFQSLQGQIASNAPALAEPLTVASVSGFGRYVLFPVLCQPRFAHLRLNLSFRTAADVFRMIERGECDLGAVYHTKVSNYLQFQPIYSEELVLIAPRRFRPVRRELTRLESYERLSFITYEESDYVFGKWFETMFEAQPGATSSVHHFEELEEVVEMVGRGGGLSIVPGDSAAAAARAKRVRILRPLERRCLNQVFAVSRAGAFLRPEVDEILEAIRELAGPARPIRSGSAAAPRNRNHGHRRVAASTS